MRLSPENSEIELLVRKAVKEDSPHDMDTIFGMNIEFQMKGTREVSIGFSSACDSGQ